MIENFNKEYNKIELLVYNVSIVIYSWFVGIGNGYCGFFFRF